MAKSIIGFHYSVGGNKNGIGAFMEKLNQAGIPFLMKGADDAGLCFEGQTKGQAHGVKNYLIYRVSTAGQGDIIQYDVPDYTKSPKVAAQEHFDKTAAKWPVELNRSEVWMEPINEPRAKLGENDQQYGNMHPVDWLGSFMLEYALLANAQGFKVCGPSFNSGEPETFNGVNDYELPGMIAYLQYCATSPEKAALSVHEYTWNRWLLGQSWPDWYPLWWGRVEAAMAAADKHSIPRTFQIFMTEWGFAPQESPRWPECEPYLTAYNEWAARWPQVKGVAAWTLQAGWGNVDNDLQSWFASLADYAVSTNFPTGEQPARTHEEFGGTVPGAGGCRGAPRVQYGRKYILLSPLMKTPEWMEAAARGGMSDRLTVGYSADDAGIADLDNRQVIAVNPVDWGDSLSAFFSQYYPGLVYTPLTAVTPAELESKLKNLPAQPTAKLLASARNTVLRALAGDCKGTPREQYARRYVLLSPKVTTAAWMEAAARGGMSKRLTVGYSADDAGVGDLDEREVIAVNPSDWTDDLNAFFVQYYPGVVFTMLTAATPAELEAKLGGAPAPSAGLDSPVGLTGPPSGDVYPPGWVDVNPIGRHYTFGDNKVAYHTGADLNCGIPVPNSDYLAPTYAIGDGKIVFAGKLGGTWWNVVVIEHAQPGGVTVYARHSHLESIAVATGQAVFKGQQIGTIGDAGGKLSAHLHFDISLSSILKTNPGHWPGENLTAVMLHYVEPRSLIRISRSGFTNKTIYIKSNANLRSGPATTFRAYKTLATGTALTALGEIDNYYLVKTTADEYGFVYASLTQDTPPGNPPTPPSTYKYSGPPVNLTAALHAPGSDWEWAVPAVQGLFNSLQMPVKWMSDGASANYWSMFNRPEFHLVRVFWKPDKAKTPQQAWDEDIKNGVTQFYAKGARRFELLNEVNLPDEGAGLVWTADTLGSWLKGLALIILNNCPQAKLYFPGMSPGFPNWTDQFAWTDKAWPVVSPVCSGFCLHAYTGIVDNIGAAVEDIVRQVREAQAYLGLKVPLVLSEGSANRAAGPAYKAAVYKGVEEKLRAMPGIEAVCWYISSWAQVPAGQDGHQEDWLKWKIGDAYGGL